MYLDHPISRKWLADNANEQEKAVRLICNEPIDSIEAFFNHWQAVGHLRGLRRARSIIDDDLEEIKQQLEDLPK